MDIDAVQYKRSHTFVETPIEDLYRFQVLDDLFSMRTRFAYFQEDQFTLDKIKLMIDDICTS